MTSQQKQIAIAEACGWTEIEPCTCHNRQARGFQPIKGAHKKHTPDYFSDLNAMHEAEKTLDATQLNHYENELVETCNIRVAASMASAFRWHATAAQRAEAFGRTINLWK